MTVLVTGGTGFVGRYIVDELIRTGHSVRCLARSPEKTTLPDAVEIVQGDVMDPHSLDAAMTGVEAVMHLVGIIEEHPSKGITFDNLHRQATDNVVTAARKAGVERWVQMSANGARKDGVSGYQTSKWQAEERVRGAGFSHWAILRPSLIFGRPNPGDQEFATQLVSDLIRPLPVWPVFGDGRFAMQPIHASDVAKAFARALELPEASGKTYCLAGPEAIAFRDILVLMAKGAGIRVKPIIPQPMWLIQPAVQLLGGWLLPITVDQLNMLVEGNTCDPSEAVRDFNLDLVPFTPETLSYLTGK